MKTHLTTWLCASCYSLLLSSHALATDESADSWWQHSKQWWSETIGSESANTENSSADADEFAKAWKPNAPTTETAPTDSSEPEPTTGDGNWWQQSKDTAGQWWNNSLEVVSNTLSKDEENNFAIVWQKITPKLTEISELETERQSLPTSAWFGRDQSDAQVSIDNLLDEAVGILGISETAHIRQQLAKKEQEIQQVRSKIAEYRQAKISAPPQSTWQTTAQGYDDKIQQLEREIAQHQIQMDQLKTQFVQSLEKIGVRLTQTQLDVLMASVVGDDIIQSSIVYANVQQISEQLMILTEESGEDVDISRRYYGMYTVLLKILLHMQTQFIQQVEQRYLPEIEAIISNVQTVGNNTQQLLTNATEAKRRQHLEANLAAQALTLKTAHLYHQHLQEQRAKMERARQKTRSDLAIAQNTFETVTLSGELVNLLRTSQDTFNLLLNIEVPELLVFDNTQMKQEFASLTQKLSH